MSVADELLKANETFARNFTLGDLAVRPKRHVAVLACMDSRILFEHCLGLHPGDAHMIRNAGGLATDDVIRSLLLSTHLLGTRSIAVIQHTECGLLSITDEQFRMRLSAQTGRDASHLDFHSFTDLDRNVEAQVNRILHHPFLPEDIEVRGYVYDVKSGKLRQTPCS